MFVQSRKRFLMAAGGCCASALFLAASSSLLTGCHADRQAPSTAVTHRDTAARHAGSGFTQPEPINFDDHEGWAEIFDGKTLKGWDGAPDVWHVEDGAIVGESTPAHPSGTTNIIWRGGEPANFELKVEMKLEGAGANGGIQFRSLNVPPAKARNQLARKYSKWSMKGYQADFDYANVYTGQLYEQGTGRGIIAWRGQMVETNRGEKPRLLATLGNPEELKSFIKPGDWNQYEVIADGNTLAQIVNGHLMSVLVDNDPTFSQSKGLIGFEIEGGGVVKVSQRDIWLKELP